MNELSSGLLRLPPERESTSYFRLPIDSWKNWMHLLWHQEEPFSSASVYAQWCVFRSAAEAGIKVMLDGQGADEQLCGYRKFSYFYLRHLLVRGSCGTLLKESLLSLANLGFFTGIDLRHSLRYFGFGHRLGGISTIIRRKSFLRKRIRTSSAGTVLLAEEFSST
jgi:hypothetical protein